MSIKKAVVFDVHVFDWKAAKPSAVTVGASYSTDPSVCLCVSSNNLSESIDDLSYVALQGRGGGGIDLQRGDIRGRTESKEKR